MTKARRRSKHRDAVETVVRAAKGPLSAHEVREELRDSGIGIATVYRALNDGVERGVFEPVEMPNGPTRYEPADRPHHHHFECLECNRVYDIEGCLDGLPNLVPDGFSLEQHEILLYGRCRKCSEDV
ncbi:MAG: transcriptional repressor [Acidobacteriota bacterium]